MKKITVILLFLSIALTGFADKIAILNLQLEIIEANEKKAEEEKSIKNSETDELKLKRERVGKEIEIINLKKLILSDYQTIKNKFKAAVNKEELLRQKREDYTKKIELMKQNMEMTIELDRNEMEYMVDYVENEINKQLREKEYLASELESYEIYEPEAEEILTAKKQELLNIMYEIKEREIKGMKIMDINKVQIAENEKEYEILKKTNEDEEKKEKIQKEKNRRTLKNTEGDYDILLKEIEIKQKRLTILREKIKRGISGYEELRKQEKELLELQINQIETEGQIELLKMVI